MQPRDPQASTLSGESMQQGDADADAARTGPALALIWSHAEPARVGEVLIIPPATRIACTIGRATEADEQGSLPLLLARLRPWSLTPTGPLQDPKISRWQLRVRAGPGGALEVERCGRGELAVNGAAVVRATAAPGDVIECVGRFALLVTRRPLAWPHAPPFAADFPFGRADAHGIVGESPAAWELRRRLAFTAGRDEHVLVHGPSGSGKELAVRAIHAASSRGKRPLVARNAATIPEALIDAELFGNPRNYPNPGMADRPGLLGEADETSLFLDEIGELPSELQARLLRVMDSGEYQRLGEARRRTTRVRLIGATNRDLAALKHDLLARFTLRVRVPGLDERVDDAPLIARHLVEQLVAGEAGLRARFFAGDEPRLAISLVRALVRPSPAHARELTALLLASLADSPGATLELPPEAAAPVDAGEADEPGETPTRAQIVAALARVGGVRERAWRELGLTSRFQLHRLLKRHGLA